MSDQSLTTQTQQDLSKVERFELKNFIDPGVPTFLLVNLMDMPSTQVDLTVDSFYRTEDDCVEFECQSIPGNQAFRAMVNGVIPLLLDNQGSAVQRLPSMGITGGTIQLFSGKPDMFRLDAANCDFVPVLKEEFRTEVEVVERIQRFMETSGANDACYLRFPVTTPSQQADFDKLDRIEIRYQTN